jgi:hypothetical protein
MLKVNKTNRCTPNNHQCSKLELSKRHGKHKPWLMHRKDNQKRVNFVSLAFVQQLLHHYVINQSISQRRKILRMEVKWHLFRLINDKIEASSICLTNWKLGAHDIRGQSLWYYIQTVLISFLDEWVLADLRTIILTLIICIIFINLAIILHSLD